MTNKEKLEIIDKALDNLYEDIEKIENYSTDAQHNITQSIYNLESTKLLLEEIECKPQNVIGFNMESQERIDENLPPFPFEPEEKIEGFADDEFSFEVKPTIYICPVCKKEAIIYGDMVDGKCLKCNQKLVKKE